MERRVSVDEQKALLRQSTLAARRSMDPDERAEAIERIATKVAARPDVLMAERVLLYAATASEVDLTAIDEGLRRRGVEVCYPRVDGDRLEIVTVDSLDELVVGHRGIREPEGRAANEGVDVVIVPGVAFDLRGGRLGHGGGHYDRLLELEPSAVRIGVAFSCQLVLRVPMDEHDQPMDLLVTDRGVHVTGGRSGPLQA